MQQTENYKLNLIETDDPFSPAPLNENMAKLEAAIAAEAAALDQRITVVEAHRAVAGSYVGTATSAGQSQDIMLGFTPGVVIIQRTGLNVSLSHYVIIAGVTMSDPHGELLKIIPGGFWASRTLNISLNSKDETYYFFAIG